MHNKGYTNGGYVDAFAKLSCTGLLVSSEIYEQASPAIITAQLCFICNRA